jgi:hypothetical protein
MTYRDEPKTGLRPNVREERDYTGWVLAALAALAIAAVLMFTLSDKPGTQSATDNTNRPSATQPTLPPANPPSTTGSVPRTSAPANH